MKKIIGLLAASLLLLLIAGIAMGGGVRTVVYIPNISPSVDHAYISQSAYAATDDYLRGISLNAGAVQTIHVNGVVSDYNGAEDIKSVRVIFYRSGLAEGASCLADNKNCYHMYSCQLKDRYFITKEYDCSINIWYDAMPTDDSKEQWIADVLVADNSIAIGRRQAYPVEMNSLLAVSCSLPIDYGSLPQGEKTTVFNNHELIMKNLGNKEARIKVKSNDLRCSVFGEIGVDQQEWSLYDVGWGNAQSHPLGYQPADTGLIIPIKEERSLYWNIRIPYSIYGKCRGENIIEVY